jgi:midasin (ATPase involved in ribosome maturation)
MPITQQLGRLLSSMPASWLDREAALKLGSSPASSALQLLPDAELEQLLQSAHTLLLMLDEQTSMHAKHQLEKQLMQLQGQLSSQQGRQGISFVWVESMLVTAMREGHWVSACTVLMAYALVDACLTYIFVKPGS